MSTPGRCSMYRSKCAYSPMSGDSDDSRDSFMETSGEYMASPMFPQPKVQPTNQIGPSIEFGLADLNIGGDSSFGETSSPLPSLQKKKLNRRQTEGNFDQLKNFQKGNALVRRNSTEFFQMAPSPMKPSSTINKIAEEDTMENSAVCPGSPMECASPEQSRRVVKRDSPINYSNTQSKSASSSSFSSWFLILTVTVALTSTTLIYVSKQSLSNSAEPDIQSLKRSLNELVFGQQIAVTIVTDSLATFMRKSNDSVLVLSFHGWTGVGKNHVTNILASSFPQAAVMRYILPLDYHSTTHSTTDAKLSLIRIISAKITQHAFSVFVFDELDKADVKVVQEIATAIVTAKRNPKKDFKVLFILLSNTGAHKINSHVLSLFLEGKSRDSLQVEELTHQIITESKKDTWLNSFIQSGLIDYIVPFLPLGETEVKKCITADLKKKNISVTQEIVEAINKNLQYFPKEAPFFSKAGCRSVPTKVDQVIL